MKSSKPESAPGTFRVELRPSVFKDVEKLPDEVQERIQAKLDDLAVTPTPRGCLKIKPEKNRYRIRVGVYRIVYRVELSVKRILIESIRHRKDVYREMD